MFNPVLPFIVFIADALIVGVIAWRTLRALEPTCVGIVETTLAWILLALVWIVGAGVVLGMTGGLGRWGFLLVHLAGLVGIHLVRRKKPGDVAVACDLLAQWRQKLSNGSPEGFIAAGLIIALAILAGLASRVEPAVFDALTYRLSRIGQWLQDGRIASYATDDPRINYMPVGPDLVIAWLLGATDEGFWLAPLSQMIGGTLLLGATFGLARTVGLSRLIALGAVALVLGMGHVAVQFTTIQSDLFTSGVFASGYLLWHRALLRDHASLVGGLGVALAWGSKGTMFYLAPGAALWVVWLIWRQRPAWRTLLPTAGMAVSGLLLFVGPSYWRNIERYHSLFGPPEAVALHHGPALDLAHRYDKLCINLKTSSVQLFDPTAQPAWFSGILGDIGRKILPSLPDQDDPYLFLHSFPRRILGEGMLQQTEPDADIISCGMLAVILFVAGTGLAIWRRRCEVDGQIVIWSAGVVGYVLVQHALVQWHQWAFRFAVLVAPWMAVAGAWALNGLHGYWRRILWVVAIVSSLEVAVRVQLQTRQAAWQAFIHPPSGLPQVIYSHWRGWAEDFDSEGVPLRLALPINYPLAAFYRMNAGRTVQMEKMSELNQPSAEAALGQKDSWLVVPSLRFMGREGNVAARTWLWAGENNSIHSLAAYRPLREGETSPPVMYRNVREPMADGVKRNLLVRSWNEAVKIRLHNPGKLPWRYEAQTSSGKTSGLLAPNDETTVTLRVSKEYISEVEFEFHALSSVFTPDVSPLLILEP